MDYIPTELLRSFVLVAEAEGFTRAGERLGRSQPAVSLQMKRLEELTGQSLLVRDGRRLRLTPAGETLLDYAQRILALNREAMGRLATPELAGTVRLGVPNEFASSFLPEILGKFAKAHPNVTLEVTCDLSNRLLARREREELDLVFALHADAEDVASGAGWTEELVWVTSPRHDSHVRTPVPLVVAPEGCVYRGRILSHLEREAVPWRVAYTCASFGGIRAGVLAGLGVTVLARSIVPNGLRAVTAAEHLPRLPPVQVRLHYDPARTTEAIDALVAYMSANLESRL
ncbi:HTH-type transcriptional regulator GltR [wastewater metagenome]|uniref:HTH-type transcriptional regulator GltR n=2 Tax=unclassified sequences TaxID=12908 RepID=A0A5B8RES8_9ZZZZ|nr:MULTISPECIES: LysR substrate-binding domain-containing protein [Arhodomonas]MCS4505323.1 LysR substrate-binding domain-containing protein [Arhodomonas aquaeolei]QEA06012.1 HTH-type transcriptional regulator GltR [uncultured organism]